MKRVSYLQYSKFLGHSRLCDPGKGCTQQEHQPVLNLLRISFKAGLKYRTFGAPGSGYA
jgi:hypothetical protein